jgi:hypothetical protein
MEELIHFLKKLHYSIFCSSDQNAVTLCSIGLKSISVGIGFGLDFLFRTLVLRKQSEIQINS